MAALHYNNTNLLLTLILSSFSILSLSSDIHDLLRHHGLPAGLFPNNVKSYTLDQNMVLQVHLEKPCIAKYESLVFFDSVVRANLSYGGLFGLEGLSDKELFIWLPVRDIVVYDPNSGVILFDIALANKTLSLSLFEEPPSCTPHVDPFKELLDFGFQGRRTVYSF